MNFRKLSTNDVIDVRFNGSRAMGNSGYELEKLTVINTTEDSIELAEVDGTEFELYFFENRWRYGSSAEVAKLLKVHHEYN